MKNSSVTFYLRFPKTCMSSPMSIHTLVISNRGLSLLLTWSKGIIHQLQVKLFLEQGSHYLTLKSEITAWATNVNSSMRPLGR